MSHFGTGWIAWLLLAGTAAAQTSSPAAAHALEAGQRPSLLHTAGPAQTVSGAVESNPEAPRSREPGSRRHLERFLRMRLAADQKAIWTAPAGLRPKDAAWLLPTLAVTGGLMAGDHWIYQQLPQSPGARQTSRDFSNAATFSLMGAAGGAFLWGHFTKNHRLRETGLLSGEALLHGTAAAFALRGIAQRERPGVGNGSGRFFQGGSSFPSQHATAAWAVAGILAHEYPGPLTKLLAYGLASGVTVSRVTGGNHFSSDVLVGSALGWFVGRQIYRSHHDPELGGAAWGSPERAWDEAARRPRARGSPYVPLDSWVYPAFERLAAFGYLQSELLGMRPWTRQECVRLLEEAAPLIPQEDSGEGVPLYHALQREFAEELDGGGPHRTARVESIYTRFTGISGPPLTDGYNFARTLFNDYGRPFQEGANAVTGLSGYATAGPFAFYVRGEYQHAPPAPDFPDRVRAAVAAQEGVPVLPYTPVPELNRFRLLEAYIALDFKGMQLSFGQQSLWWGPTHTGPLLWSTNAEPIPMLRLSSAAPFKLPGFFGRLGPMRTEFFLGQLDGHRFILHGDQVISPRPFQPQPYVHGQKFSFKPTPNLEFGFSRTVLFSGPGLPFTWQTFWKSFISVGDSRGFDPLHDPGDRRSGFDVSYRLPGLRNWATVYLDSFAEDDVSPLAAPQRSALSPGIYLAKLPHLSKLDFRAEGVFTDAGGFTTPGTLYQNIVYRSGYTNYGNILGNWVGRQGRGIQLWSTCWLSPRSWIQAGYRHQGVNPRYLRGGSLDDVALHAELRLRPGLALSGSLQYERWHFPLLAAGVQSNVAATLGMTYWPKGRLAR